MHHLRRCCPRHLDACQRAQGHVEKPTEAATQLLQTQARRVETSIILDWISCECRRATQQIRLTEGQKTSAKTRSEKNFRRALTTFKEPQPPNNVKEAVNLFLDLQTNVSPKDVAKLLEDAGYNLGKNM